MPKYFLFILSCIDYLQVTLNYFYHIIYVDIKCKFRRCKRKAIEIEVLVFSFFVQMVSVGNAAKCV